MFLRGYKRFIQDRKQAGAHPVVEGKRHLSFVGYTTLAKYAIKQQESRDSSMFAHTFLVLCWNLFARSHFVSTLMLQHLSWENDSLVAILPQHKGNQEGSRVYPKHVYANPIFPEICRLQSTFSPPTVFTEKDRIGCFSKAGINRQSSHIGWWMNWRGEMFRNW